MMALPRLPLQDCIQPKYRPKARGHTNDVWCLNLDQVEAHSGRVLERLRVPIDELGPSTHPFERGTVLYSKLRPYLNKVVVADEDGVATTELVPLRCDEAKVDAGYLAHFLRGPEFLAFATNVVSGAKMPRMVMSEFWKYSVPVPSVPEQRRIAVILDQADSLRDQRRQALAELDLLTQAVFVELFGETLAKPERDSLGSLVQEFRYGTSEKSSESGFPALRIPNVANGHLDLADLKTVPVTSAEFERLRLTDGDLLFVRTNGNPEYVGRCAVFNQSVVSATGYEPAKFIYASYLIRARLRKDSISPIVLQRYLHDGEGRRALRAVCKTSAGQYNVNTESLGGIQIPRFPKELQEVFVRRLQAIESLKDTRRAALTETERLFAALQHSAFTGAL